jgi:hypothetical protein
MTDEKGRVINLDQAQSRTKKLGEILESAQEATEENGDLDSHRAKIKEYQDAIAAGKTTAPGALTYQKGIEMEQATIAGIEKQPVSFKVGDKSFTMSVAEAQKNFNMSGAQAKKLAEDQAALDDVLKNAKSTAREKMDAKIRVDEDLENVNSEIKIAREDPKTRHGGGRTGTERERVGIGAPQVANLQKQTLDVTKLQLAEARTLNAKIDKLIASGGGAGNPEGW